MFKNFFTAKFLFEINRVQLQPSDKFFLLIGVASMVIAIIFKLAAKFSPSPIDSNYRSKLFNLFLFLSLGEIFWYGARVQLVKFFGTHFVAILIIAIAFVWLILALWKMFKHYGAEKATWQKEQVRLKYLPK